MLDLISRVFGSKSDPAGAAMPYFEKIPGELEKRLQPYIDRGEEQYGGLSESYGQMAQDPVAFLENIMGAYQPSQTYQRKREEALRAAGNTAAAGGMRGSLMDIKDEQRLANQLMSDDMQQWLTNVLGIQGAGLGGQQGFYNQGYEASRGLASDIANVLGTQGQLAYQGEAQRGQNRANVFGDLLSLGGTLGGAALGGGVGALGGGALGKLIASLGGGGGGGSYAAPMSAYNKYLTSQSDNLRY